MPFADPCFAGSLLLPWRSSPGVPRNPNRRRPISWSTAGSGPATRCSRGPSAVATRGRHDPRGGRQRRDRRAGGTQDESAGERQGDGGAGIHGRPHSTSSTAASSSPGSTSGRRERPRSSSRRLKAFALERRPGEWILGGDWDHENWAGSRSAGASGSTPSRPNNPVFVEPPRRPHGARQHRGAERRPASRRRHRGHSRRGHRPRPRR